MKHNLGRFSRRTLALLLTLTLVLSLGVTSACAEGERTPANLLTNGDFETTEGVTWTGEPVGWTCNVVNSEKSAWGQYKTMSDGTINTTSFLHLANYGNNCDMTASATQTVSLAAGTYTATIQSAGANQGSATSSLALTVVSGSTELASDAITLGGWDTWATATITFTLSETASVTVGVTGTLADSSYCDLDNATLYLANAPDPDTPEGYAVTVNVNPNTMEVAKGSTVSLTAAITNNGVPITNLETAGLSLWWWADRWQEGHTEGLTDASFSNCDNINGHSLTADVTLPSVGTYYIAAQLKQGDKELAICFVTFSAAAAVDDTSGYEEADVDVQKVSGLSDDFIMGLDISSVVSEFNSGVTFKDFSGNTIRNVTDFCKFLATCGVTHVRVRVWNDPYDASGNGYGGGNNDVDTAVEIAKACKEAGLKLLVDFHCSDFWTDPGKQMVPKAWKGYTLEQKVDALKAFLTVSLTKIKATGATIDMVQVGNETTGGFIGETSVANMCTLFNAGSAAVKALDSSIKVVIHITNPEKGNLTKWAKNLYDNSVKYDVLATSYYPYWHGTLAYLKSEMAAVRTTYGKDVMVAETSYAFTWEDTDGHENTVCRGNNDTVMTDIQYPYTMQGQASFLRDLIATVSEAGGLGVYYWEPAWITVGDITGLTGEEYEKQVEGNKEIWEQYGSGWASSHSAEYDPNDAGKWFGGSAVDNQALFRADGTPLDSINVWKYVRSGAYTDTVTMDGIVDSTETITAGHDYTLPTTVAVTYNKGVEYEVVEWDEADKNAINKNTPGTYVVRGTVTLSPDLTGGLTYNGPASAPVTYTLTVKALNLIGSDWSFENGNSNFSGLTSTGKGIDGETPYEGSYCLHWYLAEAGTGAVTYLGEGRNGIPLDAGTYTFECVAQGYAKDTVTLKVLAHNTENVLASGDAVALTGYNQWQTPTVTFTLTAPTTVDLQMVMGIQATGWGTIDCMYLYHEHTYKDTWTWTPVEGGGYTAEATFTCEQGDDTQEVKATVTNVTTNATCTENGQTVYTATAAFQNKSYTDTKTVTIPATGHSYGTPTFDWAEDGKTCTVTFTCTKGDDTKTVNAAVTSAVKQAPTCTAQGVTTYTASVNFNGKDYSDTKDVTDIPATGHTYGTPTFDWAEDGKTCTVTFTCTKGDDTKTVNAAVTSAVKQAPTCTAQGVTTYTASVTFNGKDYSDTKDVTDIPATGHTYGTPTFDWAEDGKTCTATFTCTKGDDTKTVNAAVTSAVKQAPTCTAQGVTIYTASVNFNGKDYSDTKDVTDIPALGHDWVEHVGAKAPTLLTSGYTGDTACSRCEEVLEKGTAIPPLGTLSFPGVSKPTGPMTYTDVKPGDWFYEDVKYVYENGLMNGTGDGKFSPNATLTRGMIVTILYRMEGEPATRYNGMFSDVSDGRWYTDGVEWAVKNGIVNGYGDGAFGANDPLTREQLATILYRYAQYKGGRTAGSASLTGYKDGEAASAYAVSALQWAVSEGLVNGADGKLLPKDYATRAQVAAIIHRFLEG